MSPFWDRLGSGAPECLRSVVKGGWPTRNRPAQDVPRSFLGDKSSPEGSLPLGRARVRLGRTMERAWRTVPAKAPARTPSPGALPELLGNRLTPCRRLPCETISGRESFVLRASLGEQ